MVKNHVVALGPIGRQFLFIYILFEGPISDFCVEIGHNQMMKNVQIGENYYH